MKSRKPRAETCNQRCEGHTLRVSQDAKGKDTGIQMVKER